MSRPCLLSIVVPILTDQPELGDLHRIYRRALEAPGRRLQFIYVVDGPLETALADLKALKAGGEHLQILHHVHPFGEATALNTGFRHAEGEYVMTLTEKLGVEPAALEKLLVAVQDDDLVTAWSRPDNDRSTNRQRKFERASRLLFGSRYHDLRAAVRVMRRAVTDEITLYGQQHYFLPLIAETHGFTVKEIEVAAHQAGAKRAVTLQPTLLLDLLTAFFLIRFIKRPFRLFGGFGFAVLAIGGLITAWLVFARLFLGESLVDRPALIFSSLMMVLGIQIVSVGLIGEIVTFTSTKEHKDYKIEKVVDAGSKNASVEGVSST